jgi:hypothetical protein
MGGEKMSDEQINAVIAKFLGWKFIGWGNYTSRLLTEKPAGFCWEIWSSPSGLKHNNPPDYCNDLNKIAEAEKHLSEDQLEAMNTRIWEATMNQKCIWQATARQRAMALIEAVYPS